MNTRLSVFLLILLLVAAPAVMAEESPVNVGNTICPVSGEKVGEMGDVVKVEHNGKVYNLCCSFCAKDFKKNPEKFSKIAEESVKGMEEHKGSPMEHGHHNHDHDH